MKVYEVTEERPGNTTRPSMKNAFFVTADDFGEAAAIAELKKSTGKIIKDIKYLGDER